jgi:hypothetical protein
LEGCELLMLPTLGATTATGFVHGTFVARGASAATSYGYLEPARSGTVTPCLVKLDEAVVEGTEVLVGREGSWPRQGSPRRRQWAERCAGDRLGWGRR